MIALVVRYILGVGLCIEVRCCPLDTALSVWALVKRTLRWLFCLTLRSFVMKMRLFFTVIAGVVISGMLAVARCQTTTGSAGAVAGSGKGMRHKMAMSHPAPKNFFLHPGDRVCFYGDSITEQRMYTTFTEGYITTRYPNLKVEFVNAGVGGDRVTGGWAGPIDLRLKRNVFPFKPTVVTIMLGMNDADYRPYNQAIFNTYAKGYEHIIQSLQAHLPGVRIVLIQPSAYDDVTKKPGFTGGYNGVLLRYCAFVRQLAAKHHLLCVDFNKPLVDVLKAANKINPALAGQIIPGRVHPAAAGQLVMAQQLLEGFGAGPIVSAVGIEAANNSITRMVNTNVTNLKDSGGIISWTQTDRSLPMPLWPLHSRTFWQFPPIGIGNLPLYDPDYTNQAVALALHCSHFYPSLDEQTLAVMGLKPGNYTLKIDGQTIGTFDAAALAAGINLAKYNTPMLQQANGAFALVWQQVQLEFAFWRRCTLPRSNYSEPFDPSNHTRWLQKKRQMPVSAMALDDSLIQQASYAAGHVFLAHARMASQPLPCHYELVPAGK
ncbi:MAG: SGNH/GDSL hydrolase family protein [Phycisphaerae bacterium]